MAHSPNLRELDLVFCADYNTSGLEDLIDSFETSSPFLQKLTLSRSRAMSTTPAIPKSLGDTIMHLTRLQSLSVIDLDLPDEVIRVLMPSPILRLFDSRNDSEDFIRCLPDNGPVFPKMEEFAFHSSDDLDGTLELIRRMAPSFLQSITLTLAGVAPLGERRIHNLFQCLEANCDSASLVTICLVQDADDDFADFEWPKYTTNTFRPLLLFRNLQALDLQLCEVQYALDNLPVTMASSWPLMRRFELRSEMFDTPPLCGLTLDDLLPMAKHWPQLEYLSLTVNFSTNGVPTERPGGGNQCLLLTTINVDHSIVDSDQKADIAAFLSDIFPNLVRINAEYEEEVWDDIVAIVIAMRKVRGQERVWCMSDANVASHRLQKT